MRSKRTPEAPGPRSCVVLAECGRLTPCGCACSTRMGTLPFRSLGARKPPPGPPDRRSAAPDVHKAMRLLLGYTICSARLIAGARKGSRLLRKLPDVVADFRDTFVEFGDGGCDHEGSHFPEKSPRWRRFLSYSTICSRPLKKALAHAAMATFYPKRSGQIDGPVIRRPAQG